MNEENDGENKEQYDGNLDNKMVIKQQDGKNMTYYINSLYLNKLI